MLVYKITGPSTIKQKVDQLKSIGLTNLELGNLSEVISSSYDSQFPSTMEAMNSNWGFMKFSNFDEVYASSQVLPYAVTYNISSGDHYQYNMIGYPQQASSQVGLYRPKTSNFMNVSKHELEVQESTTTTSLKNNFSAGSIEQLKETSKSHRNLPICNKISLLRKVLEGISDETQILINAKPKNKSQKIRKSNRHSRFRGVSLNGKKWQVMIMGPMKKKYFGGIATERGAAVFYDKLSILTNGLAAKTNFNYRKCDLMKIMAELEYMEPHIST